MKAHFSLFALLAAAMGPNASQAYSDTTLYRNEEPISADIGFTRAPRYRKIKARRRKLKGYERAAIHRAAHRGYRKSLRYSAH